MRRLTPHVEIITLPSGLTLACRTCPGAKVEYCGAVVRVGSRDDDPDSPGMAHFVEHTIFKGTARRSSWHIINRMERVGGELNAYTSKEETVVYTAAPAGNADRAMELIADLATSSHFPDSELDKERDVVADEINSYLDTPSEAIYDDFEELIYAGTPLAHNILGNAQALDTFTSAKCRQYLSRWYTTRNMAVFYLGPASAQRVARIVEKRFAAMSTADPRAQLQQPSPAPQAPFSVERNLDLHQSHTVMGALIGSMHAADRYPMALLNNLLGGPGMNSLLNVALREKRGYVYSVEASTSLLTDVGLLTIYFGCDPHDTAKCKQLVTDTIDRLASTPLTATRLAQAKKQYLGQLAVGSDNRESLAIGTGRAALYFGSVLTPKEVDERVQAVTAHDLMQAAAKLQSLSALTFN